MLLRLTLLITLILPAILPETLRAQEQDSQFANYKAYAAFVDRHVSSRDFVPLVLRLGGRDEYTKEELAQANTRLLTAMPYDFDHAAVLKRVPLENGFFQEARVYWNDRLGYTYFYALLHQQPTRIVVLRFSLNTSSDAILELF